jgi:hypothetical protein
VGFELAPDFDVLFTTPDLPLLPELLLLSLLLVLEPTLLSADDPSSTSDPPDPTISSELMPELPEFTLPCEQAVKSRKTHSVSVEKYEIRFFIAITNPPVKL